MPLRKCITILLALMMGAVTLAQDDLTLPITSDSNYTAQFGDSLDAVGARFDISPTCLAETNDLLPTDRLQAGQTLLLSVSCPVYGGDPRDRGVAVVSIPRDTTELDDGCDGYQVQRGDVLDTIAQALDISIVSLQMTNMLAPGTLLQPGDCLIVPDDAPQYGSFPALTTADGSFGQGGAQIPGELVVVQPGDTLDGIAQRFDASVVSLELANNIERRSELQPGMTLIIPDDAAAYGEFPATQNPTTGQVYTVSVGQTLDDIALAFDVQLAALEAVNGVNPGRNVLPGTTIFVPANAPAYGSDETFDLGALGAGGGFGGTTHTVQFGQTGDAIAALYNITRECLAESNNLTVPGTLSNLAAGQVLLIDETCAPYQGYNVAPTGGVVTPVTTASEDSQD